MNWKRIPKEVSIPPRIGTYSDWKPQLSVEGYNQCVYCSIEEVAFGGIRNFHVEHHKPKGIPRFAALENDYTNLFYACAICNTFKGDDWPNDPDANFCISCYPDPSNVDYSLLFSLSLDGGLIVGSNATGVYLTNKLYLNRPQLIFNRKELIARHQYNSLMGTVKTQKDRLFELVESGDRVALKFLKQLDTCITKLNEVYRLGMETISYTDNQTKKDN